MGFVFVRNVLVFRERTFKPFFSGDFQDGPSWRSHGSEPGSQVGGRDGNRNGSRRRILAYLPVKRKDEHLGGLGRKRERGRKKRWGKVGLKVEVEKIGGEGRRIDLSSIYMENALKTGFLPHRHPPFRLFFCLPLFSAFLNFFSAKVHVGGWGSRGFAVQVGWAWAAREQQQLVEGERYGGSVKGARYGRN